MSSEKKITNQYVKNFYNDYVSKLEDGYEYQRWHGNKVSENHLHQTKTVILSCFQNGEKINNVLEIGCGAGTYTKILSELCNSLTAVDISEEMLNYAIKKEYGSNSVQFVQGDFMELKFDKKSFDTIIFIRCFEYFREKTLAIEKINLILDDEGKLILVTKNPYYLGSIFRPKSNQDQILHSDRISAKNLGIICDSIFEGEISFKPAVFNFFFIPIKSLKVKLNNYYFDKYYLSNKIPRLLMPFIESYILVGQKS